MKPAMPLVCAAALLALVGCGSKQGNSADDSAPVKLEQIKPPRGGDWTEVVNPTPAGGLCHGQPEREGEAHRIWFDDLSTLQGSSRMKASDRWSTNM